MEGEVIAAAEKGIGRGNVTERSEGWWSENVERLVVIKKMTCRKLREVRKRRLGVVTLNQLWENYRRVRKDEKSYHEREGIEEENSEEDVLD